MLNSNRVKIRRTAGRVAFFIVILAISVGTSADTKTQCVKKDSGYNAQVDWYHAKDIIIDNSEPWNNRLLIRRSEKLGSGFCGINLDTGERECRGTHIAPFKSEILRGINTKESCVTGNGDAFAVVECKACSQGVSALTAAAGSVAGIVLPGGAAASIIGSAALAAADSQGVGPTSAIEKALEDSSSSFKLQTTTNHSISINDLNDLDGTYDLSNLVYAGTPAPNIWVKGAFTSPYSSDGTNVRGGYSYTLAIDCTVKGEDNSGTLDTVIVHFLGTEFQVITSVEKVGIDLDCSTEGPLGTQWYNDPRFGTRFTKEEIVGVRIMTTGEDAFLVDQVTLYQEAYQGQGRKYEVELEPRGTNNNVGWCISSDPNDTFGSKGRVCKNSRTWTVKGAAFCKPADENGIGYCQY